MRKELIPSRVLIGAVLFFNLQCAILFLVRPEFYLAGFGITGPEGENLIRALGILFVMWNVPYVFALVHPIQFSQSLVEAILMQAIGLIGETFLLINSNSPMVSAIRSTIIRFILFDSAGLVMLMIARWLIRFKR